MLSTFSPLRAIAALLFAATMAPRALYAQQKATVEQFLNPASPLEVTAARKADRIAWMAYDRGLRNVYTAAAPSRYRAVGMGGHVSHVRVRVSNRSTTLVSPSVLRPPMAYTCCPTATAARKRRPTCTRTRTRAPRQHEQACSHKRDHTHTNTLIHTCTWAHGSRRATRTVIGGAVVSQVSVAASYTSIRAR